MFLTIPEPQPPVFIQRKIAGWRIDWSVGLAGRDKGPNRPTSDEI